ncbi:hypothetical protein ANAPC5_00945 [Anaplasma phagocytophilum]|nr:hypothetical protein ANAPC2_01136 [Anaplasma phagocytophilum]SBO33225.1 hypothetical protein ANAPC3_01145 [Anaplasma phagocytophilum]SBO33331.1 hypothetical protein ANAPC4_01117 [Anaplasma phagocytophilum]SCV64717.1 hypothetical protein ANAPC5_00945 [Anaplasma phagocytophilum]
METPKFPPLSEFTPLSIRKQVLHSRRMKQSFRKCIEPQLKKPYSKYPITLEAPQKDFNHTLPRGHALTLGKFAVPSQRMLNRWYFTYSLTNPNYSLCKKFRELQMNTKSKYAILTLCKKTLSPPSTAAT